VAPFAVGSSVATNVSGDAGQLVPISGSGFGSSLAITVFTLGTLSLHCTRATVGTCAGGVFTTNKEGSFAGEFLIPADAASEVYVVTVTDSLGNTATTTFNAYPTLTISAPTATPTNVDLGQATIFNATAGSGSGVYTSFAWSGLPAGCGGLTASISCTPTVAGTFSVAVDVTDSNGASNLSAILEFTVNGDPLVSTLTDNPASGLVDAGQSVTFSAPAINGSGSYTLFAWSGLPGACVGSSATVTCSGTNLPSGTYTITATVTDSNGITSLASPALVFYVSPDPTIAAPSASHLSVDVGQSVAFSTSPTSGLGSGGDTYAWTGLPTGCTGTSGDLIDCTVTTAGTFSVQATVTDSNQYTATSTPLSFTVYAAPAVDVTANRTAFDVGQPVTLTATGTLGSGGYTYAWSGLPSGCAATGASLSCTPTASGNASVQVKITDSNGGSTLSSVLLLVVAAPLSVSVSANPSNPSVGSNVAFSSSSAGGTGPWTTTWTFGDGEKGTGATVDHTYTETGTYTVTVWVNDSTGGSAEKTLSLTISSSGSGVGGAASSIPLWGLAAIAVIAILVVAAIAGFLLMRKPSSPKASDPPADDATPPAPEAPTAPEAEDPPAA